jgi:hypothetical protein
VAVAQPKGILVLSSTAAAETFAFADCEQKRMLSLAVAVALVLFKLLFASRIFFICIQIYFFSNFFEFIE